MACRSESLRLLIQSRTGSVPLSVRKKTKGIFAGLSASGMSRYQQVCTTKDTPVASVSMCTQELFPASFAADPVAYYHYELGNAGSGTNSPPIYFRLASGEPRCCRMPVGHRISLRQDRFCRDECLRELRLPIYFRIPRSAADPVEAASALSRAARLDVASRCERCRRSYSIPNAIQGTATDDGLARLAHRRHLTGFACS